MLVNAECAEMISRRLDRLHTLVHSNVPQLDLAAAAAAHQLALSAALKVSVGDPLLVLFPHLDHSRRGFLTLVIYTNGTIAEARNKHIALYLIGSEGRDARS
jgi:hypothetical protein